MRASEYNVPNELSMKRKRRSTEEVVRKLREAVAMEASGTRAAEVCHKLEVSVPTLARWWTSSRGNAWPRKWLGASPTAA
jgi:DNA invertase Pin-like site-specific DNA recombinase